MRRMTLLFVVIENVMVRTQRTTMKDLHLGNAMRINSLRSIEIHIHLRSRILGQHTRRVNQVLTDKFIERRNPLITILHGHDIMVNDFLHEIDEKHTIGNVNQTSLDPITNGDV